MGKLAVQKYFSFMMLIITFLLMIFTITGLFGGDVPPGGNTARAMLVYALPLLIIGNVVFMIYWLALRRFHWMCMPLITLLCAFGRETSGFMAQDILSEMKRQKVDICCFQEYSNHAGDKRNSDSYQEYFPYMVFGEHDMVIYSRYPIVNSKNIPFDMTNNSAMWAEIKYNDNVYRVYNAHLETTGINGTLHRAAKQEMKGVEVQNNTLLNALYGKYTVGMIARSGQANMLAMDMKECEVPIIVCGDFNDVPYSYVYNTMLGDRIDGFKESGSGLMNTFRGGKKHVRIDYIFHDKSMEAVSYYKKDLSYSDHYPVFSRVIIKQ